jgi:hypothetical protein
MKKLYNLLGIIAVGAVIAVGLIGCGSYQVVETSQIADQIKLIKLYKPNAGETIQKVEINRTGLLENDLNTYKSGAWYSAHKDKIVYIDAADKHRAFPVPGVSAYWRIQYVE